MDHLNPNLNEAKFRLDQELNAALNDLLGHPNSRPFSVTWNDRNLVVEQGSSIVATYRTLWLNQHLSFEDGSPKRVAELAIGLNKLVD